MRVLLVSVALVMVWEQMLLATVIRPPQLWLQSYRNVAELQREIDMLVTRGYVLFAGEAHRRRDSSDPKIKEFILVKDQQSPVYRYTELEHPRDGKLSGISKGRMGLWFYEDLRLLDPSDTQSDKTVSDEKRIGKVDVYTDDLLLNRSEFKSKLSEDEKSWWLFFEMHAPEVIETAAAEVGEIIMFTINAMIAHLTQANNYRIYQGERPITSISGREGKFVETITINGENPYIIYRHAQMILPNGEVYGDRFSVGIYPRIVSNPFLIKEKMISVEGSDFIGQTRYNLLTDDEGNMTLQYGNNTEVTLQLIKDSDVWNEFEGNFGTTGAGIEDRLKRIYFNGERKE